ncbi:hypothetical protein [Archangium lansingense]|uniref:Lipoprotein n=1 Tax=Archangium lansingense TaxID=2995310 RepID=A0ABT3ZVV1_9BACT|nr:hypothetical protein [Archangium lansinium]MCY1073520.1 hypothetical protein [Archangium lansinium]
MMGLAVAGLSVAALTRDEPPCAYVLAQADTAAVATPAVVVLVSPKESESQPIRIHLDEEGQDILGYSHREPGTDAPADVSKVFVPGLRSLTRAARALLGSSTLDRTCESLGVSTPAVPVHVSRASFTQPGALLETPTIALLLPDRVWSAPGHVLSLPGSTLVIPAQKLRDAESLWPVTEPYLSVDIGGEPRTVRLLPPRPEPAAHSSALPSN